MLVLVHAAVPLIFMVPLLATSFRSTFSASRTALLVSVSVTVSVPVEVLVPPVSSREVYSSSTIFWAAVPLYLTVPFSVLLAAVHSLP